MSKKVPDSIAKEIKKRVFKEADQFNYLTRSKTDNGTFLDQLVTMKDVGGRLSQYMPKAEITTYIKDAILNRYSKDKTQEERPIDFVPIIQEKLAVKALFVERENKTQISLFKSPNDHCYVVVADGTYLKWKPPSVKRYSTSLQSLSLLRTIWKFTSCSPSSPAIKKFPHRT